MEISQPNKGFNFAHLSLANPQPIHGGSSYFAKIALTNAQNKDKSLYIQLPKCKTKQGIVTTKKEKYCDFLFEKDETSETDEFFEWIDHLEKKCQGLIDAKKTLWFHNDMTIEDIENMMVPVCRLYKSGKNIILRSFIDVLKRTGKEKCLAYDERENVVELNDIKETDHVIPLLVVEGIIFSTKSFEISIKVSQIMVCDDSTEKDDRNKNKCLIKTSSSNHSLPPTQQQQPIQSISSSPSTGITVSAPQPPHVMDTITKKKSDKVNNVGELEEVQFDFNNIKETIVIKNTHETYKNLLLKINELKKNYVDALSTANQFKEKYKIKDIKGISDFSVSEDIEDIDEEDIEDIDEEEEEDDLD
jgi:hypothetical protein